MPPSEIDSGAFRQALLRSERLRILGIIAFVAVFTAILGVRIFVFGSPASLWGMVIGPAMVAYELWLLRVVQRALQAGRDLAGRLWALDIVLEMSLPALGTAFLVSPRVELAYRPLATPWVLAFFAFIILSTLRLSPRVCRLAGAVAVVGYLAAAWHHGWHLSGVSLANYTVTQTAVLMYAAVLLAGGFLAGMVAGEIRKHVQAALREAETRSRLQQVEHDLDIARSIQRSLLPRVRPSLDGFEVAGWNRPADATGGDYFDWKQLPDGRLVVSLADVTGHGIGPALLASVCRAYARASFDVPEDLQATLQRINHSFGEDLTPGRFATFVAAVCKAGDSQVELLSAGHGPLFVYSAASGTMQNMNAQAVPLGILPDLSSGAAVRLELQPGDLLLLITDGFFEWENAEGEQFGLERLGDCVRCNCELPPEEIIARLYDEVVTFSQGTSQQDDLTAVVVKKVLSRATTLPKAA